MARPPTTSAATGVESGTGSAATPSSSYVARAAPTPFNTYCDDDAYGELSSVDPDTSVASRSSQEEETPRNGGAINTILGGQTINLSPTTSRRPSQAYSQTGDFIPQSTRPVPAPPQLTSTISGSQSFSPTQSFAASNIVSSDPPNRVRSRFLRRIKTATQVDPDTHRLQQLGYDAVLGRDYTFWSSLAISWINIGSLQGTIFGVLGAYHYGGPTMLLVAWPISAFLALALVFTMSELASAYPVAGAMASWSWKCARGGVGHERQWGWVMGPIVMGGHVGNLVLVCWQNTNMISGTMALAYPYTEKTWHIVLFFLAIVFVVGTVGSTARGASALYWKCAGGFVFSIWCALCISLLATGVRNRDYSNSEVISTVFETNTGFTSRGYVWILGWQTCTLASGSDASAHMSEETQNPSRNVPKAMTMSILFTYVLAYISIVILFISVDPQDASEIAGQSFPFGHILVKAIGLPGAITLCCLMIIVLCLQLQAQLQASSRFVFALARDRALPFSDVIKRTNTKRQPVIATWIVVALWAPCALLLIGKQDVIRSVATMAASTLSFVGYLIPVGLYLVSGKDLQHEGRSSWSLRKWSRPTAAIGVLFCCTVIIVQCFPQRSPVTPASVSWSPVVVAFTLLLSWVTWKLYGNSHYSGPIRALTKWETGVEIDLDSTLQASTQRQQDASGTSLKLAVTPCYDEPTRHTLEIATARTVDTVSIGEWAPASFSDEWTSGSVTTASSRRDSNDSSTPRGLSRSRCTMGRVDEEEELRAGDDSAAPQTVTFVEGEVGLPEVTPVTSRSNSMDDQGGQRGL